MKACAPSAVTRAIQKGVLAACVLLDGDIDVDHTEFRQWGPVASKRRAQHRDVEQIEPTPVAQAAMPELPPEVPPAHELMQMSFGEVCNRFGSVHGLERTLYCKKLAFDAERLRLKNDRDSYRVYSVPAAHNVFIGGLINLRMAIVRDGPYGFVDRISPLIKAGLPREDVIKQLRSQIDNEFVRVMTEVERAIRNGTLVATDIPNGKELEYLRDILSKARKA